MWRHSVMWVPIKHWVMALLTPRPFAGLIHVPGYLRQYRAYRRLDREIQVRLTDTYPCLTDAVAHTPFDPHYFYQSAWLARRLAARHPQLHVDVGSSVMAMSVLSAAFPVVFLDYRPVRAALSGFSAVSGSVTRLPFMTGGVESISSLHVLEHIGLGRYGDPLDAEGSRLGAGELERVTCAGGRIYVSVPIGRERVCFNAHRVLAAGTVMNWFRDCRLVEFSFVDDGGRFHENHPIEAVPELEYGCGMFIFEKI